MEISSKHVDQIYGQPGNKWYSALLPVKEELFPNPQPNGYRPSPKNQIPR